MSEIVIDSEWRELAQGCGFTEGPVGRGDEICFVSVNRGLVYATKLDGSATRIVANTGGGPNGAAVDALGTLWIAQNGGRVMDTKSFATPAGIQNVDGTVVRSVDVALPDRFDAPNDCAFGPDGRLYLTDPHGRLGEPRGDSVGRVWAVDVSTGATEVIADGLAHPNGLCFTSDGAELWVSDTKSREITAYARRLDGSWSNRVVDSVPWGGPDGMALDEDGTLWVAATDAEGLAVRTAEGQWKQIDLGRSFPTNVAFVGPERRTLVVTAARGGRLLAAEVATPGLALQTPAMRTQ